MIISPLIYGNSYQLQMYYQFLIGEAISFFLHIWSICFKYSYRRGKSILLINHCPCVIWIMTNTRSLLLRESIKIICKLMLWKLSSLWMRDDAVIMGRMFWITQFNKSTPSVIISLISSFQTTRSTHHRTEIGYFLPDPNSPKLLRSSGAIKSW